ncbi:MAG: hypothetical protein AB1798_18270 [Spirochaetota bacterium]
MIQYKVKGNEGIDTYVEVVKENQDGYDVVITCVCEDYKKEIKEYISRQLFDTCLRTGYLREIGLPVETTMHEESLVSA